MSQSLAADICRSDIKNVTYFNKSLNGRTKILRTSGVKKTIPIGDNHLFVPGGVIRTNFISYSEDMSNAAWVAETGVTVSNFNTVSFPTGSASNNRFRQQTTLPFDRLNRTLTMAITFPAASGWSDPNAIFRLFDSTSGNYINITSSSTDKEWSLTYVPNTSNLTTNLIVYSDRPCVITGLTKARLVDGSILGPYQQHPLRSIPILNNGVICNNFEDFEGTIPAVKDGRVGCILDAGVPQSNLLKNTWSFTAINPDTATYVNGSLSFTRVNSDPSAVDNTVILTSGKQYTFTFDSVATNPANNIGVGTVGGAIVYLPSIGTNGPKRHIFTPTVTGAFRITHEGSGPSTITLSNMMLSEVGIVARQSNISLRPILRKGPKNYVKHIGDMLSGANWLLVNVVASQDTTLAPDGTPAWKLRNTPSANSSVQPSAANCAYGGPYTRSVYVKAGGTGNATFIFEGVGGPTGAGDSLHYNIITNTWSGATQYPDRYSATAVGDGWIRLVVTVTKRISNICGVNNYVGGYGSSASQHEMYVWGWQNELGSEATPLIKTYGTQLSSGTGAWWFDFDGADDKFDLSPLPWSWGDPALIIVSARATLGTAGRFIFSTGASAGFASYNDIKMLNESWRGYNRDGTINVTTGTSTESVGTGYKTMITSYTEGNNKTLRINGVQSGATDTTVLTSNNITNATLGQFAAGGSIWGGEVYALSVIKQNIPMSNIGILEQYINTFASTTA